LQPDASRVVDAKGRLVLPGMIDMHVHFRDPGFTDREDFETGTRSAAAGGVTTVADMPNTVPSVVSVEAVREKIGIADKKALVDFAFIAGAGELDAETLKGMAEEGIVGYKTFMIARFKELAASDGQMLENFETIVGTGLPCLIHAENQDIVEKGMERAIALGRLDPIAHTEFRPAVAEDEAITRTILLAGESGVHLHICHMSTKGGAKTLGWAKKMGRNVTGETSANYLLLNADVMKEIGPYAKIDPPLRGPEDQEALWSALNSGVIDAVASDHAPYPKEEKDKGWENIFEAPSGGTGIQTHLPLMLDSVDKGKTTLGRLVESFSVNPARIMGLFPRKGALVPGADADIVIVDLDASFQIKAEDLHSKQKVTAFEGYKGKGIPLTTIVRGEIVMEEGTVIGKTGYGEYQRPLP
jgi:dihydroorotase (multifunctional complex type)